MTDLKEVVERVLLPLQLSLGIWHIMKVTPLWVVMRCTVVALLSFLYLRARSCFNSSYLPDTNYIKLQKFDGFVFKRVFPRVFTAGPRSKLKNQKDPKKPKKGEKNEKIVVKYLGKEFTLEREGRNRMLVQDGFAYYITDKMWEHLLHIEEVAPDTVFLKDYKEVWEEVISGDIMEFEQVLDAVILDNRKLIRLDHDYFLPVNLVISEDKLLKILNLVALFLQTQKHVHWLISALLSITSAVMGFSTNIRLCVHWVINRPLCWAMHMLFNPLPLFLRKRLYFYLNWVDNLKPGNDLEFKTGKRELSPLIAGGGKARYQSVAHPCKLLSHVKTGERGDVHKRYVLVDNHSNGSLAACSDKVGPFYFKCGKSFYIEWIFDNEKHRCSLKADLLPRADQNSLIPHDIYFYIACGDDDSVEDAEDDIKIMTCDHWAVEKLEEGVEYKISVYGDVYCGSAPALEDNIHRSSVDINCGGKEAIKLFKLALCMAQQSSGTLKCYEGGGEAVSVRRFTESINAYVRSGYPPLYSLDKINANVR